MLTLDMTTMMQDTEDRDARRQQSQCTPGLGFPSGLGAEYPEDDEREVPELAPRPAPGPQLQLVPVQDSEPPRARRILAVGARLRGCAPILLALASSGCGRDPAEVGMAVWCLCAVIGSAIFTVIA